MTDQSPEKFASDSKSIPGQCQTDGFWHIYNVKLSVYIRGSFTSVGVLHPWEFYIGGSFTSVGVLHPWEFYIGGSFTSVGVLHRWEFYIGGSFTSVGVLHRWEFYIGVKSCQSRQIPDAELGISERK